MEYNIVAAKWWANKIRNVSLANFDNGDTSESGLSCMIFATNIAVNNSPSEKNIDLFEDMLSKVIKERVEENGSLTLSVDYNPDATLGIVAQESGIGLKCFPWKTVMKIKENEVRVKAGYNGTFVNLI